MIVVNATIESTAADLEAIKEALTTMETHSRAESGCLDYTFSIEVSDPNKLRITEKWETLEDLTAHFQEPHMADFRAALAAHPPRGMQASFYRAEEFTPQGL